MLNSFWYSGSPTKQWIWWRCWFAVSFRYESIYSFSWRSSKSSWGSPSSCKVNKERKLCDTWHCKVWFILPAVRDFRSILPLTDDQRWWFRGRHTWRWLLYGIDRWKVQKILSWKLQSSKFSILQKPINCDDDCNVFSGQTNSVEHHDHCDETSLRNSSSADWSGSCSDTNGKVSFMNNSRINLKFPLTWQQRCVRT